MPTDGWQRSSRRLAWSLALGVLLFPSASAVAQQDQTLDSASTSDRLVMIPGPPSGAAGQDAWSDAFAIAVDSIRSEFPTAFARAEIADDLHAWVGFKDEAPDGAVKTMEDFGRQYGYVEVSIRTGMGFSEGEIERSVQAAHYAVYEHPAVIDAVTDFDFETMTIVMNVAAVPPGSAERLLADLRDSAIRQVEYAAPGLLDHVVVSIDGAGEGSISVDFSNSEHLGGEFLMTWQLQCTSGFVVRVPSTGVRGIATAGHCTNGLSDDGQSLTFMAQHVGSLGDFQWHRGSQSLPNAFYSGTSATTETARRNVTAASTPSIGSSLCHNGATTHRRCGMIVQSITACQGSVCNLIRMHVNLGAGGDSGGPLFTKYGTAALGLVKGAVQLVPDGPLYGTYSRLDRMYNALGVVVATS